VLIGFNLCAIRFCILSVLSEVFNGSPYFIEIVIESKVYYGDLYLDMLIQCIRFLICQVDS
jgi:hypothetical protein